MSNSVFYVGTNGFPRGSAEVEKQKLILKTFQKAGYAPYVLCCKNYFFSKYPYKGKHDGISYFYTTFLYSKTKSKLFNKFIQIFGFWIEKFYIALKGPKIGIISSRDFLDIISYLVFFKLRGAIVLMTHVEDVESVSSQGVFSKLNNWLFNNYAFKLVDGALPISSYLEESISSSAPMTKQFKLPVMVDYIGFQGEEEELNNSDSFPYFLYCGSTAYEEIVDFIAECYQKVSSDYKLIFVVSGQPRDMKRIREKLSHNPNIIIYSEISFKRLISLYKNAKALLIPLRETVKDKARFPHKIGEYTASGNPVITNNWGEVPFFFKNLDNALVCNSYNVDDYVKAMQFVVDHKEEAERIGLRGKKLAKEVFDYNNFVEPLNSFIISIKNK